MVKIPTGAPGAGATAAGGAGAGAGAGESFEPQPASALAIPTRNNPLSLREGVELWVIRINTLQRTPYSWDVPKWTHPTKTNKIRLDSLYVFIDCV